MVYPTWFGMTTAQQDLILKNHQAYLGAWVFTGVSHLILIAPWSVAWLVLFFLSEAPFEGAWLSLYTFWLTDLLVVFLPYLAGLTELVWLAVIGDEWGKDDGAFKLAYPLIFAIIYLFYTPLLVIALVLDHNKAIYGFEAAFLQTLCEFL